MTTVFIIRSVALFGALIYTPRIVVGAARRVQGDIRYHVSTPQIITAAICWTLFIMGGLL